MSAGALRLVLAAAAAAVLLAAAPGAAHAHALLLGSTPERGATLKAGPGEVVLRFSEGVEGSFGAVRVFDAKGGRVDTGGVTRPGGDRTVGTRLRPDLPDGTYVATYRVVSADSHPISGGFVFTVGAAAGSDAPAVADLIGDEAGPATETAFGAARAIAYAATAILVGGLVFLLFVWSRAGNARPSGAVARRARRLGVGAAAAGALASLAGLALQGASAAGISFWSALDADVVHDVLATRFGEMWAVRAAAFVLFGGVAFAWFGRERRAAAPEPSAPAEPPRELAGSRLQAAAVPVPARPAAAAALLAALALVLTPAFAGHPAASSPSGVLVPVDVLHVVAMSAWLGGLVALVAVVPAATRALDPPARTRLLAGLLLRFSPLALACVIALVATGLVQSLLHIDGLGSLLDTAFGRAIVIKVGLLAVLIGLGIVQRRRVVPALRRLAAGGEAPGGSGRLLRTLLRAEVAVGVVVLAVTAALVSYPPPDSVAAGPYSSTKAIGAQSLETTIDPARVGRNQMHLYLLDSRSGAPFDGTKELRVTAAQPGRGIGAIAATPRKAGPGHYVVDGLQLVPAGEWRIQVISRISEFEEHRAALQVEIK